MLSLLQSLSSSFSLCIDPVDVCLFETDIEEELVVLEEVSIDQSGEVAM